MVVNPHMRKKYGITILLGVIIVVFLIGISVFGYLWYDLRKKSKTLKKEIENVNTIGTKDGTIQSVSTSKSLKQTTKVSTLDKTGVSSKSVKTIDPSVPVVGSSPNSSNRVHIVQSSCPRGMGCISSSNLVFSPIWTSKKTTTSSTSGGYTLTIYRIGASTISNVNDPQDWDYVAFIQGDSVLNTSNGGWSEETSYPIFFRVDNGTKKCTPSTWTNTMCKTKFPYDDYLSGNSSYSGILIYGVGWWSNYLGYYGDGKFDWMKPGTAPETSFYGNSSGLPFGESVTSGNVVELRLRSGNLNSLFSTYNTATTLNDYDKAFNQTKSIHLKGLFGGSIKNMSNLVFQVV
jgi:hypothetical protein